MRQVTLAALQMACVPDREANIATMDRLIRAAAAKGARIVLPQELFEFPYFCQDEAPDLLLRARPADGHPTITHMQALAAELGIVIPVSFYELAGQARFNSIAILDADGTNLGIYRKTHIPQGSGYQEKYYFSPGDTGFRVFNTRHARLGVGICWDQWFPETARALALLGAEILAFPTAIGSELLDPDWDSSAHWQRVMQGHAGANLMPLIASNRIGTEPGRGGTQLTFYGSSFIADATGAKVAEADRESESILTATLDLDATAALRAGWGVFRDRRPEHYGPLATLDGRVAD